MRQFGFVLVLLSVACGDGKAPERTIADPVPGPATPSPVPGPTLERFSLSGYVTDTAERRIASARVEVVDALQTRAFATSDDQGQFSIPGILNGTATLTASKDGYLAQTKTVPNSLVYAPPPTNEIQRWEVKMILAPAGPSADLVGLYTLTLTADPACTNLPGEARTRRYPAVVAPQTKPTSFLATLSGAAFFAPSSCTNPELCALNRISIGVAEDYAYLLVTVAERPADSTFLVFDGRASGTVHGSGMTTPFDAVFLSCPTEPVWTTGEYWACAAGAQPIECYSRNHQLALQRR